jgi:nucleotide-binding universal stress UspA family protein
MFGTARARSFEEDEVKSHELLRGHLECMQERVRAQSGLDVDIRLLEGVPAVVIAAEAEVGADLVVLASHGQGGASRYWLGSVTDTLVRRLDVPILVVRPPAQGALEPAIHRRVVIPLDGTPETERILDTAIAVLGTEGVEYTLLRVCMPLHPVLMAVATRAEIDRDTAEERAIASRYLEGLAAGLRARGADVRCEVRFSLYAAPEILAAVKERDATLVALATHGRGPIGRFMLGSVGDKVLRGASVPVLLRRVSEAPVTP